MSNPRPRPNAWLVAGALLLALAMAFVATYLVAGARVDADGVLREPFGLIPLAWLSGLAGAVCVAIGVARRR